MLKLQRLLPEFIAISFEFFVFWSHEFIRGRYKIQNRQCYRCQACYIHIIHWNLLFCWLKCMKSMKSMNHTVWLHLWHTAMVIPLLRSKWYRHSNCTIFSQIRVSYHIYKCMEHWTLLQLVVAHIDCCLIMGHRRYSYLLKIIFIDVTYAFANAKLKKSIFNRKIPEFLGDIGIILNTFQSWFPSTIEI